MTVERTIKDLNKHEGRLDEKGNTIQHRIYEVDITKTETVKIERAKEDIQAEINSLEKEKAFIQTDIDDLIIIRDQMVDN